MKTKLDDIIEREAAAIYRDLSSRKGIGDELEAALRKLNRT